MASTSATTATAAAPAAASNKTDAHDTRGRDVVGCLMSAEYQSFTKGNVPEILRHCQLKCSSPELLALMANMGLHNPTIHFNPHIQNPNNVVYKKFHKAVQELDRQCCFGVVFHGTAPQNIANILENGLDPGKRNGQAYGPGVRVNFLGLDFSYHLSIFSESHPIYPFFDLLAGIFHQGWRRQRFVLQGWLGNDPLCRRIAVDVAQSKGR